MRTGTSAKPAKYERNHARRYADVDSAAGHRAAPRAALCHAGRRSHGPLRTPDEEEPPHPPPRSRFCAQFSEIRFSDPARCLIQKLIRCGTCSGHLHVASARCDAGFPTGLTGRPSLATPRASGRAPAVAAGRSGEGQRRLPGNSKAEPHHPVEGVAQDNFTTASRVRPARRVVTVTSSAAGLEARCSARRPGGLGRRLAVRRSRTRVAEDDEALRTADTVTADEIE